MNQYIDHTLLRATAKQDEIEQLVKEAKKYKFASVCINPVWVKTATQLLNESNVRVCTVVGFPLGANTTSIKVLEAKQAIEEGATEIDMVISVGHLQQKNYDYVYQDIARVVETCAEKAIVKVIIETCLLTEEEKVHACVLSRKANAHFVKTSTGFSLKGATIEDVALMRKTVGNSMGIKASGGIKDIATANRMIEAGASRIGTSSGVEIMKSLNFEKK